MTFTICIVDDDRPERRILSKFLTEEGYWVIEASTIERVRQFLVGEDLNLMLVKAGLEGLSGAELLKVIRTVRSDVPVVLMADAVSPAAKQKAKRNGARGYISTTQMGLREIAQLIKKILVNHSFSDSVPTFRDNKLFRDIIGQSPKMQELFETMRKIIDSPTATILIRGESGTGKELVARALHYGSPNFNQPFVEINCAALPETLLESELFGYERGAFTDAKQTKKGLLELAQNGTFFLDEVGELSLGLQAKLVKTLEEKVFRRVGGTKDIRVTMRIMAATNKNLEKCVEEKMFREDLYYRLNVISLYLPPLRERNGDILVLANHFIATFNQQYNRQVKGLSPEAEGALLAYPWPGNVRELKNAIERAILLSNSELIKPQHLLLGNGHVVKNLPRNSNEDCGIEFYFPPQGLSLEALEKTAIRKALEMAGGNQCQAARLLKISRETLRYRLRKYGLTSNH